MRVVAAAVLVLCFAGSGFGQSRSVWLEELTAAEARAAVAAGKTTAIYFTAGLHQSDENVTVPGKHFIISRYVAQRVAEELGNALVLPINAYAPAVSGGEPNPPKKVGSMNWPGTLTITEATYGAMSREIVTSAIVTSGFKNVLMMGDHGFGQETAGKFDGGRLKKVAEELDAEWKPQGVRVYYIPMESQVGRVMIPELLTKRNVPAKIQIAVDDVSEVWSIDPKGIREDKIPADVRPIASPELGKSFTDLKINMILQYARSLGLK